jgi:hypothetical protein
LLSVLNQHGKIRVNPIKFNLLTTRVKAEKGAKRSEYRQHKSTRYRSWSIPYRWGYTSLLFSIILLKKTIHIDVCTSDLGLFNTELSLVLDRVSYSTSSVILTSWLQNRMIPRLIAFLCLLASCLNSRLLISFQRGTCRLADSALELDPIKQFARNVRNPHKGTEGRT